MLEILVSVVVLFLNGTMGTIIFLRNRRSWTNRLFLLLALLINTYIIVNYISLNPPGGTLEEQLAWTRLVMFVTSFIGPTVFLLVDTFPREKIPTRSVILASVMSMGLISAALSMTDMIFSGIELRNGSVVPVPGPAILVFLVAFVGLFLVSFLALILKYRRSEGVEKAQLFYFLIGVIGTFSAMALTTVIPTVVFGYTGLVFLGPNMAVILLTCVAYAIAKHRFLDLKLLIFRTISFFALLATAAVIYVSTMLSIGSYLFGTDLTSSNILFFSLLSLAVGYSLPTVRRFVEHITAPLFFHNPYDERKLLKDITDVTTRTIDLDRLVGGVFRELFLQMRITSSYIALYEGGKDVWRKGFHFSDGKLDPRELYRQARKANKIDADKVVMFHELSDDSVREYFRKFDIEIILPLTIKREMFGVIALGPKASGEPYSSRDIDVLRIVAPELAVGVKNALAYEEIRNFNETLKKEVKTATAGLRNANRSLKELDARKDEFISIASHELRTPLTAIRNYLWLTLNQSNKPLDAATRTNLEICYHSAERMIMMVNDTLTISRIERNKLELETEKFNLVEFLESLCEEMRLQANEKEVHLTFTSTEPDIVVKGDSAKLREVFQNLLMNSFKFVPAGEGMVKVVLTKEQEYAVIRISDNGPGIPKDSQEKLFTKFGKVNFAYDKSGAKAGTGLGLYICKKIVDLHSGKISVQSSENKGATFIVQLPVHSARR
ncbi:MAG: ATP-binding protein [Patescibacteria group bacterium]|nr:ATP-binding protein [Patescibacteria group bacterium]